MSKIVVSNPNLPVTARQNRVVIDISIPGPKGDKGDTGATGNAGTSTAPSFTKAAMLALPSPTAGDLVRVSNAEGGMWIYSGVQWVKLGDAVNVRDAPFNARGDGVTDDTAAIDAAWAAAKVAQLPLLFGASGTYPYNGAGLSGNDIVVIANPTDFVKIQLSAGVYFINSSVFTAHLHLENLRIWGGAGAFRHTFTGNNVTDDQFIVRQCRFVDYTATCIGSLATDMPNWKIQNNLFYAAASSSTSMGIALAGLMDSTLIEGNDFLRNRVHIKLAQGGNSAHVRSNSFIRFSAYTSFPRTDVWCVPNSSSTNAGEGFVCDSNRFGNENLAAQDYRILYADADAATGADFATRLPQLAADSTGYIIGHQISNNLFPGAASNGPLIYSTTPNVIALNMRPNALVGTAPSFALQFRTVSLTNRLTAQTNCIGEFRKLDFADTFVSFPISNDPGFGILTDSTYMFENRGEYRARNPVGDTTGYINLLPTAINAFSLSNVTKTTDVDWYGQGDAIEATWTVGNGTVLAALTKASIVVGRPAWIEFDLKAGASSPLTEVFLTLIDFNNRIMIRRNIRVPGATEGWIRYQFPYTFRTDDLTAAGLVVRFQSPITGTLKIGRVAVYHGRGPVECGPIGWGDPTGTATRTTFATGSVTLPQLAERVKALIDDLKVQRKLRG